MKEYKAVIIDNEGNIDKIPSPNGENHATVLGEFGRNKYPRDQIFPQIKYNSYFVIPVYVLQSYGNIVILNISQRGLKPTLTMYLPRNYENRITQIEDIISSLSDYTLSIESNMYYSNETGDILGDNIDPIVGETPIDTFNRFLDSKRVKR